VLLVAQQFLVREKHSSHHPTTVLSGACSKSLLVLLYSENGFKGTYFATMEDIKLNAMGNLWKTPK
jgi:hypothetical protein